MKLNHLVSLLIAAMGMKGASYVSPVFRGSERLLANDDPKRFPVETLKAEYDPTTGEGWLKYKMPDKDEVKIVFDDCKLEGEKDKKTRCIKEEQEPPEEATLPIENLNFPVKDAEWVGEVLRDFDMTWKNKRLDVDFKRFTDWDAEYDPTGDPKCWLKYEYSDTRGVETIKFPVVEQTGDEVTCTLQDFDSSLYPAQKGLNKINKKITSVAEWADRRVKDAMVTWEKGDPLVLFIESEASQGPGTGRDDFEYLSIEYDELMRKVLFEYELKGEGEESGEIEFSGDEEVTVLEDGLNVTFEKCASASDGISFPVDIKFKISEAKWFVRCDSDEAERSVVVKEASLMWTEDSSCETDNRRARRQLRKRGRAKGNIKADGR